MFRAFCLGRLEVAVGWTGRIRGPPRFDDIDQGGIAELENTIDC